ncbi:MAG: exo-alpha-sialidase [Armatimonadetes bacterium]|nr:exo-alpha-sialidase [Armatimonadota bacterium]
MFETASVFPPEALHNHASCLAELPGGELLVCWYRGSGERSADDVAVMGARRKPGSRGWSKPFVLADTPDYPDCNPCLFMDALGRLWLVYVTLLANEWHTALLKYRVTRWFGTAGPPPWETGEVLHVTPGDTFVERVRADCDASESVLDSLPRHEQTSRDYLEARRAHAQDKFYRRLGWMPRAKATLLTNGRLVLPLYSDGFDFSLMALSDDHGATWHCSQPLISFGGVQPSVVEKQDGTLVAYLRDNGPPPYRVLRADSSDRGETWSPVADTDIPNPGSGLEAIRLTGGHWLLVCNDTEKGRHRLAVMLSEDEGNTWPYTRYLEQLEPGDGSFSYPSALQARDGTVHVSYSHHRGSAKTIQWACFEEAWVRGEGG